ncbi:MAG: T9SS type A sorting domain-containing protein [candidate division Zixibacteria bacterium]|nr:T9SS type A sorting domain-containing protein [candidate division Zixibacteria bacterium]
MKKVMFFTFVLVFAASAAFAANSTFKAPLDQVQLDTSSAPDAYGYTWVDNDAGGSPVYEWIDISGTGVAVEGLMDDNAVGPFDIGFDFAYYWYSVDHFYIGSNGYISFASDDNYSQDFPMIPSSNRPNDIVVPLACDLDFTAPYGTNACYYYTNNVDTLIVTWDNVLEWNTPYNSTATHTFQLILTASDSAITYQYGEQGGDFMNTEGHAQIGIEDLLGNNGICYMFDLAPPNRMPHDGLVIRIHADPDPDFVFHDVGVAGAMNESSGGVFCGVDQSLALKALVKNYGTMPEDDINVNCKIKRNYVTIYNEDVPLSHLEPGEEAWVTLPSADCLNEINVHAIVFKTTLSGDEYYWNNSDTCELRTYILPQTLAYIDTTISYSSWQGGGGGFGNEFVAPEPITVTMVKADMMLQNQSPAYFFILPADENGVPDVDNILWADTLAPVGDTGWISMNLHDGIDFNTGDKFFATILAGGEGVLMGVESGWLPLCNRGWENTGSYAPSRDRALQDICIAIECEGRTGIEDEPNTLPNSFHLNQNYPNPFNANTEIGFSLENTGKVSLSVYNIAGQKISTLVDGVFNSGLHRVLWDGTSDNGKVVSSGVYFYHLEIGEQSQTKKMVLLK